MATEYPYPDNYFFLKHDPLVFKKYNLLYKQLLKDVFDNRIEHLKSQKSYDIFLNSCKKSMKDFLHRVVEAMSKEPESDSFSETFSSFYEGFSKQVSYKWEKSMISEKTFQAFETIGLYSFKNYSPST